MSALTQGLLATFKTPLDLSFRSATHAGDTSFSNPSIVATVPTGAAIGDLEIIIFSMAFATGAAPVAGTTPAGWNVGGTPFNASGLAGGAISATGIVYWRIATTTPTTATCSCSNGNGAYTVVRAAYKNPRLDLTFGQLVPTQFASGTTITVSGITTTKNNALVLGMITQLVAQAATPTAPLVERDDFTTGGMEIADFIQTAAGATGSLSWTLQTPAEGYAFLCEFWSQTSPG